MNLNLLRPAVQEYINSHLKADINEIVLAKPLFDGVSQAELASQITAKKKSASKLPTWFNSTLIYYPPPLSIEQSSSEITAAYKAGLAKGHSLVDLTSGFGVDSFYFAQQIDEVYSCEINAGLSAIAACNAKVLGTNNIKFFAGNGLDFLQQSDLQFDTIYIDPARRSAQQKVFRLKDCTPDVTSYLELLFAKSKRIIIKTSPLLDLSAGLLELPQVSEIHIVSVKNECKELLWVMDNAYKGQPKITCATLNETIKTFHFSISDLQSKSEISHTQPTGYLYEPDAALLKSGAFNLIANRFGLKKLHQQSQLYYSDVINTAFLGRIFEIESLPGLRNLKKEKNLRGNVIVRNFPETAAHLVKKYKIIPDTTAFIIFTQTITGYIAIKARIIQHY